MELNENEHVARKTYSGSGSFSATAGQSLEIKIGSDKKLEVEVPEGKNWEAISININITEVDA